MRTITEITKYVADKIESNGHYQGRPAKDTSVCPVLVLPDPEEQNALAQALGLSFDSSQKNSAGAASAIIKWNDSHTTEEVLSTLRSVKTVVPLSI